MLREYVDLVFILVLFLEKFDLCQRLVGERIGHDETWVSGSTSEVHQPTLSEQNDPLAVGKDDVVNLRLDVFPLILLQRGTVDFVIEVADVADNCLVFHLRHVIMCDDLVVAGRRDENICLAGGLVHGHNSVSFHCSL